MLIIFNYTCSSWYLTLGYLLSLMTIFSLFNKEINLWSLLIFRFGYVGSALKAQYSELAGYKLGHVWVALNLESPLHKPALMRQPNLSAHQPLQVKMCIILYDTKEAMNGVSWMYRGWSQVWWKIGIPNWKASPEVCRGTGFGSALELSSGLRASEGQSVDSMVQLPILLSTWDLAG